MSDEKNKSSRLGKGLDAFFGQQAASSGQTIQTIKLSDIKAAPWQPRKHFDELDELAESIKIHGVLQPILLKKVVQLAQSSDTANLTTQRGEQPSSATSHDVAHPHSEVTHYEIIAGERRFRASSLAKLDSIPAIIMDFSAQQTLEVSMIENLQRRDLNAVEKAEGFAFLIQKLNISQEELAKRLGMNRSVITNFLRINTLNDDIKEKIRDGKITAGHAKMLVNKEGASEIAKEIVEKKLSVRQIEEKLKTPEKTKIAKSKKSDEIERFQEMISEKLGVTVRIEWEKSSGQVILEFENLAKLEEIISAICFG